MDQFIARTKIELLFTFFEREIDPSLRSRFKRRLIDEEDKLGRNSEALNVIETHITNGTALIKKQESLITSMEHQGLDTTHAWTLLNDLNETLFHFEDRRHMVLTSWISPVFNGLLSARLVPDPSPSAAAASLWRPRGSITSLSIRYGTTSLTKNPAMSTRYVGL